MNWIKPFIKTLLVVVLHGWVLGCLDPEAPAVEYCGDSKVLESVLG